MANLASLLKSLAVEPKRVERVERVECKGAKITVCVDLSASIIAQRQSLLKTIIGTEFSTCGQKAAAAFMLACEKITEKAELERVNFMQNLSELEKKLQDLREQNEAHSLYCEQLIAEIGGQEGIQKAYQKHLAGDSAVWESINRASATQEYLEGDVERVKDSIERAKTAIEATYKPLESRKLIIQGMYTYLGAPETSAWCNSQRCLNDRLPKKMGISSAPVNEVLSVCKSILGCVCFSSEAAYEILGVEKIAGRSAIGGKKSCQIQSDTNFFD